MKSQKSRKEVIKVLSIILLIFTTIYIISGQVLATEEVQPEDNQYMELRATQIIDTEENGKQVIMELWGHDIDFKGLAVRFTWDQEKFATSNLTTNSETNNIEEYFEFEEEFKKCLEIFTLSYDVEGSGIRAMMTFNPPVEESEHVIDKEDVGKVVTTEGGVLLGKFSFKMKTDEFDMSSFKLVSNEEGTTPTGIKIDISLLENYQATSTFRFTDETASRDATLQGIKLSHPEEEKEYQLSPEFDAETLKYETSILEYIDKIKLTAITTDDKATMKVNVPIQSEEETIQYEEKDLTSGVPLEIEINKLGQEDTKLTITVTAEDGTTIKQYEITIKRPYGTLKGKITTVDTEETTQEHIAMIRVFESDEIAKTINWEEVKTNFESAQTDDIHQQLESITNIQEIQTNPDGTYEIKLIPGKYDVLIDKPGYLDHIYTNVEITENNEVTKENKELIAGDANKDGIIQISDKGLITQSNGLTESDEGYLEEYDLNNDGTINLYDKGIATQNNGQMREIE